jgi:hypothetical protein
MCFRSFVYAITARTCSVFVVISINICCKPGCFQCYAYRIEDTLSLLASLFNVNSSYYNDHIFIYSFSCLAFRQWWTRSIDNCFKPIDKFHWISSTKFCMCCFSLLVKHILFMMTNATKYYTKRICYIFWNIYIPKNLHSSLCSSDNYHGIALFCSLC